MPDRLYDYRHFASVVRTMYPELAGEPDDGRLTHAVLTTHPEFKQHVIDPLEGTEFLPGEKAGAPPSMAQRGLPPPKAPTPPPDTSFLGRMQQFGEMMPTDPGMGAVGKFVATHMTIPGIKQFTSGAQLAVAKGATISERGRGVSGMIRGGLDVAAPAFIPTMAAAPLTTAAIVGAGTAVTAGVEKLGLHPLIADIAGLTTAIATGSGINFAKARSAAITRGNILDQLGAEHDAMTADTAREMGLQEGATFDEVAAHARVNAVAAMNRNRPGTAFDYVTQLQRYRTPVSVPFEIKSGYVPTPPPRLALPSKSPSFLGGPPGFDPNAIDVTSPYGPKIATSPPDIDALISSIGEQVGAAMERPAGQPSAYIRRQPGLEGEIIGEPRRVGPPPRTEAEAGAPSPEPDVTAPPPRDELGLLPEERAELEKIQAELSTTQDALSYGPRALLEKIAANGGVGDDPQYAGELRALWEDHPGGTVAGVGRVLRREGGSSLDDMAGLLQQDPEHAHIKGPNELLNAIDDARGKLSRKSSTAAKDLTPVYWDIAKEGPRTPVTHEELLNHVNDFLKTGKGIWGQRALKIARQRIEGRAQLEDYTAKVGSVVQPEEGGGEKGGINAPPAGGWEPGEPGAPPDITGVTAPAAEPGAPPEISEDLLRSMEVVEPGEGTTLGASGESAASAEALSRQQGMAARGETFAVQRPGGQIRRLIGPEAVDYNPRPGETFGRMDRQGNFSPLTGGERPGGVRGRVGQLFSEETGHLILNVAPNNKAGMRKWLNDRAEEFGEEDWHQQAVDALDRGDVSSAWRLSALAGGRAFASATGRVAGAVSDTYNAEKFKAAIEKDLGSKLPSGVKLGQAGVLIFPKNPSGINPKFSDLLLGKSFVKEIIDATDPSQIVRVADDEGKVPFDLAPELRISGQMADQILRDMPDEVMDTMKMAGIEPAEMAAHFRRTVRSAAQTLNMLKQWQDKNWDAILHLSPELGSTLGPGAAGRLEFMPPETVARVLAQMEKMKRGADTSGGPDVSGMFDEGGRPAIDAPEIPKTWDPDGEEATSLYKKWANKQRRMAELGKTVDLMAEKGSTLDRVLASAAMDRETTGAGRTFDNIMRFRLSALLSQPATAIKVLFSHATRYNLGIVEEALAGAASHLVGDHARAADHWNMAKNMVQGEFSRPGTVPKGLLRSPASDDLQTMFDYTMESVRGLDPEDARRSLATLEATSDKDVARFTGAQMLGPDAPVSPGLKRAGNVLSLGIRTQSAALRATVFDSTLRTLIQAKGDVPADILRDPSQLIQRYGDEEAERMVGAAVSSALDYTYSAPPYAQSIPGAIVSAFTKIPVVSSVLRTFQPFPRFTFATQTRWVWDHSPGAFLIDVPLAALGRGRLGLGLQRQYIEGKGGTLGTIIGELNTERYNSAKSLSGYLQAKVQAREAATSLKAIEARAEKAGEILPGLHDEMVQASSDLQARMQEAQNAQTTYKESERRIGDLDAQRKQQQTKLQSLQEINAPTWEQYIARQATGAMIMSTALAIRGSEGAKDTRYYQYRLPGGHLVDLRPVIAGFAPILLAADLFHDIYQSTDLGEYKRLRTSGAGVEDAFSQAYHGKYTAHDAKINAVEAFLSLSPMVRGGSFLADFFTGRESEPQKESVADSVLSWIGETMGSFLMPLKPFSDVAGEFYEPEAESRLPEQGRGAAASFLEPLMMNVPGLRELIPSKVSPMTGQPIHTVEPLAHQFAGITQQEQSWLERETTKVGLPYGKAVPKVSGDREFDNIVAHHYAEGARRLLPDILGSEEYTKLSPELKRDQLASFLNGIKAYAYAQTAQELDERAQIDAGKSGAQQVYEHLQSPLGKAKLDRWRRYLDKMVEDNKTEMTPPDAEPVMTPAASGGQ